jgi:hypothetical protein
METTTESRDNQLSLCLCGLTLKTERIARRDSGKLAVNNERPAVFFVWCSRCIRDWR